MAITNCLSHSSFSSQKERNVILGRQSDVYTYSIGRFSINLKLKISAYDLMSCFSVRIVLSSTCGHHPISRVALEVM